VDAKVIHRTQVAVTMKGVAQLHLDRDPELLATDQPLRMRVNGEEFSFAPGETLALHSVEGRLRKGEPLAPPESGPRKKGTVTGPFRDIFEGPVLFVFGASDPAQSRANEEVARGWAKGRQGMTVRYPVMSDEEFFKSGQNLAHDKSLFLVGNAASNRVLRELEAAFPIRRVGASFVLGGKAYAGPQVGAAFILPNPKRRDRYVAVVEGLDATGTWRSLSLPELLPDFTVYDETVAPARGQMVLGSASVRTAGFFQNDWTLPP
jgi:hypothetical protein